MSAQPAGEPAGVAREPSPADAAREPSGASDLLKMQELAERAGVSPATIKHYLREGLLPEPVRTSRNMAYYPPEFVDRIRLIKRLQEQRFMPLKLIKRMLEEDPDRITAMVELEDRILELAVAGNEPAWMSAAEARRRYGVPQAVLDRLEEIGVLTPDARGYEPDDVKVIEAIGRFRAGGFDETLGFTVYDTLRYREALEPLVAEEVRTLLERLAGRVSSDRAAEIIRAGAEPLRELIGAMHSKLLLAQLRSERRSGGRRA
jgi:DNA-binding transcriptional MerR regulator